jgi:predicted aminopeptidase
MRCAFRCLLAAFLCLSVAGCALPYYLQAAHGQVDLMRQRVPITEVIADPDYAEATREQLSLVLELRQFAVDRLALPDNESYSSYVELEREFVVWNVVAAGEFTVDPMTWCFPVAGCVAYRGYFDRSRAQRFARRLDERGYDVFVGGATAYSTLGHFADPVLSTMLDRGEIAVAATLFHELAHQRVYVKGDTELSESFATALEQYAVELWLIESGDAAALERYLAGLMRQREFAALVARQRSRLAGLYADGQDAFALAASKQAAFEQMQREYEALRAEWGGRGDYDGWFDGKLNNAALVALTSYQRWVPGLRARLNVLGPEAFYQEIAALSERDAAGRAATLDAWNEESVVAALTNGRKIVDAASQVAANDRFHAPR